MLTLGEYSISNIDKKKKSETGFTALNTAGVNHRNLTFRLCCLFIILITFRTLTSRVMGNEPGQIVSGHGQ